jgi:ribosomal subunit interface protein
MKVIIKTLKGLKIDPNIKDYAQEKVLKYEPMVEEPAVCEIVFSDELGPKGGVDKSVHITMTLPGEKNPIHVEALATEFMGAMDLAQEKLEQEITRYKEQKKIGSRYPAKYEQAKIEEEENREV